MPPYPGLLYSGAALTLFGVVFYVAAVAGVFFGNPTPWDDIGLYALTAILLGLGVGTLWLRRAKIRPGEVD